MICPSADCCKDAAFGPEEVTTIITAFEGACKALGLTDRNDPVVEMVAAAVFRAAEIWHGQRRSNSTARVDAFAIFRPAPGSICALIVRLFCALAQTPNASEKPNKS